MAKGLFLLYESATGYALFEVNESEEIAAKDKEAQKTITDLSLFSKICKLKAYLPFKTAEDALENINSVSEGIVTDALKTFLNNNLPKKSKKYRLGVMDPKIGQSIAQEIDFQLASDENVMELLRGCRMHFSRIVKGLEGGAQERAQLGLAHSYSRCKVKFNVNRNDNMIIQAIALLDQMDKDVNTFSMRCREWYSWHFPELVKIVNDNHQFSKCVLAILNRADFCKLMQKDEDDEERAAKIEELNKITLDEDLTAQIIAASKISMGVDCSPLDMKNIQMFASRVTSLAKFQQGMKDYLADRMANVAPNLQAHIGDSVGARLISHAGSLTNLAKYPASTVQVSGFSLLIIISALLLCFFASLLLCFFASLLPRGILSDPVSCLGLLDPRCREGPF